MSISQSIGSGSFTVMWMVMVVVLDLLESIFLGDFAKCPKDRASPKINGGDNLAVGGG
jgi:hypothetical protein